jgi:putative ABC transport system permease protein
MQHREPPRVADALLRRVLPYGKRGLSILGDLREEFRAIPEEGAAKRWYWLQVLRLSLRYKSLNEQQAQRHKGSIMPHDLRSDLRTAFRMFVRNPGTSTIIVFTLATAIGAATIGFAFADLALFRGLPVDDASRVVSVFAADTHSSNPRARVSGPDFLDYRERATMLERMSVFREGRAPLIKDGQSSTLAVSYATAEFFLAMGQGPALGRVFGPGDDAAGASPIVLLAHHYWQETFAGRPDALGRQLQIGRDIHTIVGVVSSEMEFGNLAGIDVWVPLRITPEQRRDARNVRFIARLREGVEFDAAAAQMAAIGTALANEYPDTNAGWSVRLIPIRELTGGQGFWVVIALFLLSIGLLIAIATANVSNLVMVRAISRQRELAVRTALGAKRGRLVRQLIVEGLALSIAGAALSLPLAYASLRLIGAFSPEQVFQQLEIDAHEFGFVATLAFICPLLFSLAPARTLARTDTRQILAAGGGRGTTASLKGRGLLVVAQVALAVVLLIASSLALRSITRLYTQPTGMQTGNLLIFTLDFDEVQYPTTELARAAAAATLEAVRGMPGAGPVAMLSALPILGAETIVGMTVERENVAPGESKPTVVATGTTRDVGAALGLTLLAGQWWRDGETDAVVVSRETATRYLGGVERAVGRTVMVAGGSTTNPLRIVGISNDVVSGDATAWIPPRLWMPLPDATRRLAFMVKSNGDPSALTSDVRAIVARTAAPVPLENLQTLDEALRLAASSDYVVIGVLAGFAVLALILAATGLFGVVSYTAAQRTAEFGTRMALGASAIDVVRLVARQSLKLLAVGLALGLVGGIAVGFGMRSALYGMSPLDPITFGGVAALLTVVTLAATALPAWRAGRIDPIVALRE